MGWGAVAGAVIGSAFNKHSADTSWKHQKEYAQHAHQWEVADLRAAGLNPILSAGGQGAPMSSVASAQDPGFATAGAAIDSNNLARKTVKSEIAMRDKTIEKLEEEKKAIGKNVEKMDAEISMLNSSAAAKEQELVKYKTENQYLAKQYEVALEQGRANTAKAVAERDVALAKYQNIAEDTKNKEVIRNKEKAIAPAWERAGKYIDKIADWFDDGVSSAKDKFDRVVTERKNYGYEGMD